MVSRRGTLDQAEYVRAISGLAGSKKPFAVAAIVRTEGSTLGKPGFKIVVGEDGRVLQGTLGGGCPEGPIVETALQAMQTGVPRLVRVHLVDADRAVAGIVKGDDPDEIFVETNCGGTLEIYVEPYLPPRRLVLIGQGGRDEIEEHLVHLGHRLGYEVAVIDHLPQLEEKPDLLVDELHFDLTTFPFQAHDAVVVLTKGERDLAVLAALSRTRVAYVGLLASRARSKQDFDELRRRGTPDAFLDSVHTPIGLDLGGAGPAEIALAILAEITAERHGRTLERKKSGPS